MATAQTILDQKQSTAPHGNRVVTVRPDATVRDAVNLMNDHHIGAVVAIDSSGGIAGVFTERDLLKRVVGADREIDGTCVREVMTRDVITCRPDTSLDDMRIVMRARRIRHLPVIDQRGKLLGIISIGDLNIAEVQVMTETISYLERYMTAL